MAQENQDQIIINNLRSDVEEACLLLSYAAQGGLNLKMETAKSIAKSKVLLAEGKLSGDEEAQFYLAYEELAKLAKPVTVASLSAAKETGRKSWRLDMLRPKQINISEARQAAMSYWNLTLFALGLLLAVQIYWVVGFNASKAIKDSRTEITKLTRELEEQQGRLKNEQKTLTSEQKAQGNIKIKELDTQKKRLEKRKSTYKDILHIWNLLIWAWLPYENDTGTTLALADFTLIALQGYLLPLLYGLLGACTYVLRMLSSEIRNLIYTGKSYIRYRARILLGTLSGLAITWFIQPDAAILKSLSSLALAFLAGYSVEILFAVMDKFVGAFSGKTPAQEKAQ